MTSWDTWDHLDLMSVGLKDPWPGYPRTSQDIIIMRPLGCGMSVGLKNPIRTSKDIPEYLSQESGITLDTSGSNGTRRTFD